MNHQFFLFVQAAVKQITICLVGVVMLLGLMQPAAQAMPALIMPDGEPTLSAESLDQKRAERREIQSKASEAANTEEKADSIKETLTEKLNLDEIVEENEIVDGVKKAIDSDK